LDQYASSCTPASRGRRSKLRPEKESLTNFANPLRLDVYVLRYFRERGIAEPEAQFSFTECPRNRRFFCRFLPVSQTGIREKEKSRRNACSSHCFL
jgi:hypothetical protein